MKVVIFPEIFHDGQVLSIDIDPKDRYLASSGKDNTIKIWDLQTFISAASKEPLNKDELWDMKALETIEAHSSVVNQIRWNPVVADTLASSDTSGKIFIHSIGKTCKHINPSANENSKNAIMDLSWSADGRLIAWCDTNSAVFVYDLKKNTIQKLSDILNDDKSPIQRSIAFDPTNNFLALVGSDTIVHLFQYHYNSSGNYVFKLNNRITKLVNEIVPIYEYKRISWSPDGEYVSIPTASKGHSSVISFISRSTDWSDSISLVGHNSNCEVVKYNPKTYNLSRNEDSPELYNIIATSGSDKKLVLWNTTKETPLFVLDDLSVQAIVDLSWDSSGRSLFASTMDGHIICLLFQEEELGFPISQALESKIFEMGKLVIPDFDKILPSEANVTSNRKNTNTQILKLDQKYATDAESLLKEKKDLEGEPIDQIKHRETLPSTNVNISSTLVFKELKGSSSRQDTLEDSDLLKSAMSVSRNKLLSKKIVPQKTTNQTVASKMKVTTKDGKRRIQPILVSHNNDTPTKLSKPDREENVSLESTKDRKLLMEYDKPSYSVSEDVYRSSTRTKSADNSTNKKFKKDLEPVKFVGSVILNPTTTFSKLRLSAPRVRLNFQVENKEETGGSFILDIRNGSGNETVPSRITYFKGDKQIWYDFVPRYISLCVKGDDYWAISTVDGQILIYDKVAGYKKMPPLIIGSPLSVLENHGCFLMAVSVIGELFVWDIKKKKMHLSAPSSLASLLDLFSKDQGNELSKSEALTMCSITSKGIPLVTLSNGSGYLYNADLGVWQTVSESWWAFGSHYWDSLDNGTSKLESQRIFSRDSDPSIIEMLEQKSNESILKKSRSGRGKFFNKISKNMLMKEGFENLENTISLNHLENRILCCEILMETKDFHKFFITYARRISELGLKAKLYNLCLTLLGPIKNEEPADINYKRNEKADMNGSDIDKDWEPQICGIDKHELLKEVILDCAENRDCQRILLHFAKKIDIIKDSSFSSNLFS